MRCVVAGPAGVLLVATLNARPVRAAPRPSSGADVIAAVLPACVSLDVEGSSALGIGLHELVTGFRLPQPDHPTEPTAVTGSGVIVSADGLVLTNHHVIAGATRVTAHLPDGRVIEAAVLGTDPRTDIAVLRLTGDGPFPWVPIGDSDSARPGALVYAVGHPYDLPFTVSSGIISATHRRGLSAGEIEDYLQTDVAVNPGGSGGPLFDEHGVLIGINTAIYTGDADEPASGGLSFAVPSKMAWRVAQALINQGRVPRPGFGLVLGFADPTVSRVVPDSPAERAGLLPGDRILAINGAPVSDIAELRGRLAAAAVGEPVRLRLNRAGQDLNLVATPIDERLLGPADVDLPDDGLVWAGLVLAPLTAERQARYGVKGEGAGLLVLAASPSEPGDAAGLVPGDLILGIYETDVPDGVALRAAVGEKKTVIVRFRRGSAELFAAVGGLGPPHHR